MMSTACRSAARPDEPPAEEETANRDYETVRHGSACGARCIGWLARMSTISPSVQSLIHIRQGSTRARSTRER